MKFFGTIDQAIKSLYQMAMSGARNKNSSFVDYAKISDQEKMFLESKTSLDLSGIKYHAIDESGIRHIDNLHGVNGSRLNEFPNQIPVTEQDYLLIPDIVKSENVSYSGKDDMGQDLIKYEYHNGDTFYYLEEVRVGRQKLSGKTFYKTRGTPVTQVQQNNIAQPLYTRASTTTNIPQSGEKSSDNLEFMRKRLHKQINPIIQNENVFGKFDNKNPAKYGVIFVGTSNDGKNYLVGLSLNSDFRGIAVNDIRGLFPKETVFGLRWIQQGKLLYLDKEKVQSLIAQQRTNLAEVSN